MKPVIFHTAARAELEAAFDFYEARRAELGHRFRESVEAAAERIRQHPEAGAPLAGGFRKRLVPGFPYSLIYRVWTGQIYLTAVAHQHRQAGYWRTRKPDSQS